MAKLAVHPKTRAFATQPDFIQMIGAIQRNPNMVQMYLQDKRVMTALSVLIGVDIEVRKAIERWLLT